VTMLFKARVVIAGTWDRGFKFQSRHGCLSVCFCVVSRGSSVGVVSDYGLDDRGSDPRQRQRIFLLASAFRPALEPKQPPVQWVPGVLSPGINYGRGMMQTTHPHLVPRLGMSRSFSSSPPRRLYGV
jgi:hypothetical protein